MNKTTRTLLLPVTAAAILLIGGISTLPSAAASAPEQPRCMPGFVWREATPSDFACVPPGSRDSAAVENALAGERREGFGPFGSNTCKQGFVWREATPSDLVCVTPGARSRIRAENGLAASRTAG